MGEPKKLIVPNSLLVSEIASLVSEGESVSLKVKGNSMLPFIKDKDVVKLAKADKVKLYDIVLASLSNGEYVIHRIVGINGNELTLMGDGNLRGCEKCTIENVLAVAIAVIRDGNEYECRTNLHVWKARIWIMLCPIRKYLLAIYKRIIKYSKYENN